VLIFDNPAQYLQDAGPDMVARINRLTTIITNLENCVINAASNADVQNYTFNDGQSTITTNYRSIKEISDAMQMFDIIRQRLINKCEGRATVLRSVDTLPRRWYY
jgi:hypothetical protein